MKADELGFKIVKPTLLLDKDRVLRNIEKMAGKAKASGVRFRPHFKTHQSAEIGNWFKDFGVQAITVSSLDMALYFAKNGWSDITVAFLVNMLEINKINKLAGEIKLNLLIDSEEVVSALDSKLEHLAGMWIKIDTGYHRTGVLWDDFDGILSLARKIKDSAKLDFRGLLTHAGHSYYAKSVDEIRKIHDETVGRMTAVKSHLMASGFETCEISVGDTPTCSVVEDFNGVDEIRPGNFVFYDLMQEKLGACTEDEIAVAVACPIVGKYRQRNQVAVYGGLIHLSSASMLDEKGRRIFGYITAFQNGTFGPVNRKASLVSLSQEHGMIEANENLLDGIETGDSMLLFPVHSCLTCNLHSVYETMSGGVVRRSQ